MKKEKLSAGLDELLSGINTGTGEKSPKKKHFLNSKLELDEIGEYPFGKLKKKETVSPFYRQGGNNLDNRDQLDRHFLEMHKTSVNLVAASNRRITENSTFNVSSQDMFRNQKSRIPDLGLLRTPAYLGTVG